MGQREEIFHSHENAIAAETDQKTREEQAKHSPPPIPLEDQVVCTTAFTGKNGSYVAGVIYHRNSPGVKDPETRRYFATPQRPLA